MAEQSGDEGDQQRHAAQKPESVRHRRGLSIRPQLCLGHVADAGEESALGREAFRLTEAQTIIFPWLVWAVVIQAARLVISLSLSRPVRR
jgi:hypothetical protein